jgi:hypothetical protein
MRMRPPRLLTRAEVAHAVTVRERSERVDLWCLCGVVFPRHFNAPALHGRGDLQGSKTLGPDASVG